MDGWGSEWMSESWSAVGADERERSGLEGDGVNDRWTSEKTRLFGTVSNACTQESAEPWLESGSGK